MSSSIDPHDRPSPWARGSVLAGRYQVRGELGRGGWGVVLGVVDAQDRPLALKLLLHDATDEALRRFAREAEVIGALHSAHVCRIYDTGTLEDGSPFIVMDRLVGDDLDQVWVDIQRGRSVTLRRHRARWRRRSVRARVRAYRSAATGRRSERA